MRGDGAYAGPLRPMPQPEARLLAPRSAVLLSVVATSLSGCASLVFPPEQVARPATVYVLREALHVGIVAPDPVDVPTRYVEYGYGDWAWYALGQESWWRVFPTVLWPTQSTLCRRVWPARDEEGLARLLLQRGCEADAIEVEADRVVAFVQRMDKRFDGGAEARRDELRMDFVKSEGGYWFWHTCADVAAEWCEELGCDVGWVLIRGSLRVKRLAENEKQLSSR